MASLTAVIGPTDLLIMTSTQKAGSYTKFDWLVSFSEPIKLRVTSGFPQFTKVYSSGLFTVYFNGHYVIFNQP